MVVGSCWWGFFWINNIKSGNKSEKRGFFSPPAWVEVLGLPHFPRIIQTRINSLRWERAGQSGAGSGFVIELLGNAAFPGNSGVPGNSAAPGRLFELFPAILASLG